MTIRDLLLLAVLGVVAYLVESAPLARPFRILVQFVIIVAAILILLSAFGVDLGRRLI